MPSEDNPPPTPLSRFPAAARPQPEAAAAPLRDAAVAPHAGFAAPAALAADAAAAADFPPVSEPESGQKLLQFLQRRLGLPQAMLHRWVRTGQVRVNGGRCKPFTRVSTGDAVRLPPFALRMAAAEAAPDAPALGAPAETPEGALPPLLGTDGYWWVFNKPAGLPTHPGSGHEDSLATRLARHFSTAPFRPTPAHRLDKDTSGALLVAASYEALVAAQEALRSGEMVKEYVAWVQGRWPYEDLRLLRCHLRKEGPQGQERMRLTAPGAHGAREALCLARPLCLRQEESLVQVRLITGRTHQIRAQLAALGHPVLGDGKYGPPGRNRPLCLHALRLTLPNGRAFACLPPWTGPHALAAPPDPLPPNAAAAPAQPPSVRAPAKAASAAPKAAEGPFPLGEKHGINPPLQ